MKHFEGEPKSRIVLYFMAFIAIIVVFIIIGLLVYWNVNDPKLIEQSPKPFPLLDEDKIVKQGGHISYEYDYCKYTDLQPTINKQFVDGLIFQSEDIGTILDKGCGHVHREINIPETLPPGSYHVLIRAIYKPDLSKDLRVGREIIVTNETEEFRVVKSQ